MIHFYQLPNDIQNYIINILSQLEYDCLTTIHPLLYLKNKEYYYNLPSAVDPYNRLIVNKIEYHLIRRSGKYPRSRHDNFKIINNPIVKWLCIYINQFIITYMTFLTYTPSLVIWILLPIHFAFIIPALYIEQILSCTSEIKN